MHAFFPMRRALLHRLHHNYKQSRHQSARLSYSDPKIIRQSNVIHVRLLRSSRARL